MYKEQTDQVSEDLLKELDETEEEKQAPKQVNKKSKEGNKKVVKANKKVDRLKDGMFNKSLNVWK